MSSGVEERIKWFLSHKPDEEGQCLHHVWEATAIPEQGIPNANEGWQYAARNGQLHAGDRSSPRGSWVYWSNATFGHVALSLGDGRIASTDVEGAATTGIVPLSWVETNWGQSYRGWTDWFGEFFDVGEDDVISEQDKKDIANMAGNQAREAILSAPLFPLSDDKDLKRLSFRQGIQICTRFVANNRADFVKMLESLDK